MSRKLAAAILVLSSLSATPVLSQPIELRPAELPPVSFDGREFVDSRGCVFLRSTFGGEVTWVPRFGPDRQPVCGATPTRFAVEAPPRVQPVPQPAGTTARPAPAPAFGKEPPARAAPRRAVAPARSAPPRPRYRGTDASGRHPDCPTQAQFGQMVRTSGGRIMVLCVASPDQFPEGLFRTPGQAVHAPVALPPDTVLPPVAHAARGVHVQVGSFRVPENATRLQARLAQQGYAVRVHRVNGLHVVTVGGFTSGAQAQNALHHVRSMGFRDAFLRH